MGFIPSSLDSERNIIFYQTKAREMYVCTYYVDRFAWTRTWNVSGRYEIPVSEESKLLNNNSIDWGEAKLHVFVT